MSLHLYLPLVGRLMWDINDPCPGRQNAFVRIAVCVMRQERTQRKGRSHFGQSHPLKTRVQQRRDLFHFDTRSPPHTYNRLFPRRYLSRTSVEDVGIKAPLVKATFHIIFWELKVRMVGTRGGPNSVEKKPRNSKCTLRCRKNTRKYTQGLTFSTGSYGRDTAVLNRNLICSRVCTLLRQHAVILRV